MAHVATADLASPATGLRARACLPCNALMGRESVGQALCVTNLRDDATS